MFRSQLELTPKPVWIRWKTLQTGVLTGAANPPPQDETARSWMSSFSCEHPTTLNRGVQTQDFCPHTKQTP